jgi:nitroreductase
MNSYPVDVGRALSHLSLAATSEGLGTSWVFAFSEEKVRAALHIPEDAKVVGLSPLGFPDGFDPPEGRKHLSEILSYNGYE